MKITALLISILLISYSAFSQTKETIKLSHPDSTRSLSVMKALSLRASCRDYDTTQISNRDLSDLLWAANGINREEEQKRTAPSAINGQDIDVYVCNANGIYLYNYKKHQLDIIVKGDYRALVSKDQDYVLDAPISILLVSDISRFKFGDKKLKLEWAFIDAGIVSQNISLFCASVGLGTIPRTGMKNQELEKVMKLNDSQHLILNQTVGYAKE